MIKVNTIDLRPGMVTAKPILTKHGQEIVANATPLTAQQIARLSFYKITCVYVTKISFDELTHPDKDEALNNLLDSMKEESTKAPAEVAVAPKVEQNTPKEEGPKRTGEARPYSQRLKTTASYQEFQTSYSQNIVNLMTSFDAIKNGTSDEGTYQVLLNEAATIFASKTSLDIFVMIHSMRSVDDSTYAHSLNVGLIARAIGRWLHFSKEDLDVLTLAGLLHDIGKTQIPNEILTKQGKLTDEEFSLIRGHAQAGHKILKNTDLDTRIKLAALQHHERFDGSGYPRGLDGDEIDDFASIIAIADVYDAMTAARAYRAPLCAFQVIAAFEEDGFQKYNPKVIYTFLKRVANCYNNSRVLLSNGQSGHIVFLNESKLSRPIIKTDNEEVIDLLQPENSELFIKSII